MGNTRLYQKVSPFLYESVTTETNLPKAFKESKTSSINHVEGWLFEERNVVNRSSAECLIRWGSSMSICNNFDSDQAQRAQMSL